MRVLVMSFSRFDQNGYNFMIYQHKMILMYNVGMGGGG